MFLYILIITTIFVVYVWLTKMYYWQNKSIKGPAPMPFIGNLGKVLLAKQSTDMFLKDIYERYQHEKYVGVFIGQKPGLLIRDPALIKQILITDFRFFHDRGIKVSDSGISKNIFVAEGDTWKTLRPKLTTVFTAKKLTEMFPSITACIDNLVHYIDKLIQDKADHEIKYLMSKYTSSVMGSCLFNVDFNVYSEEMKLLAEKANIFVTPSLYNRLCYILDYIFPGVNNQISIADPTSNLLSFFNKFANHVFCVRNENISPRKDLMDVLLQLKKDGKATKVDKNGIAEIKINDDIIAAQIFAFYIAGYETSSGTLSFLLHELALNENIQNRAYAEIFNIAKKYNNEISFESLAEMTYLKMIFKETLRKYPVVGSITRKSVADYILPDSNVKLERGTLILIPVVGIHRDSKYFSDPEKFDPERFLQHSQAETQQILEKVYMPFGAGPRQCIGLRFAELQSLLVIATLLLKFKIHASSKTTRDFVDDPKTVTLSQSGGLWLKLSRRKA